MTANFFKKWIYCLGILAINAHASTQFNDARLPSVLAYIEQQYARNESLYQSNPEFDGIKWVTGQIIAISEATLDPSTIFFEVATGSRYGHIGLVVVEDGVPYVYHANPPLAQRSSVKAFLGSANLRREKPLATVLEPTQALSEAEQKLLVEEAKRLVSAGTDYNFSMVMNPSSLNCSEFIYQVFSTAGRDKIGAVETVAQQNISAYSGKLLALFDKVGRSKTDLKAKVITPASIVRSPSLKVLTTTLPTDRVYSDAELYQIYKQEGSLALMGMALRISPADLEKIFANSSNTPYRACASVYGEITGH